jgi:hypothetical protein
VAALPQATLLEMASQNAAYRGRMPKPAARFDLAAQARTMSWPSS